MELKILKHYMDTDLESWVTCNVPSLEYVLEQEKIRRETHKKGGDIGIFIKGIKDMKDTVLKTEAQIDTECAPSAGLF